MLYKVILLMSIFIIGEIIFNLTVFKYIKNYFDKLKSTESPSKSINKFMLFDISVFKGILERFVILIALILNISQILIVFGTLKIGSRLGKDDKILNDYFLIGNFTSILISLFYWFSYLNLKPFFNN